MKKENKGILEKQKIVEKALRENSKLKLEKLFENLNTSINRC